jgi:hypothetical protein
MMKQLHTYSRQELTQVEDNPLLRGDIEPTCAKWLVTPQSVQLPMIWNWLIGKLRFGKVAPCKITTWDGREIDFCMLTLCEDIKEVEEHYKFQRQTHKTRPILAADIAKIEISKYALPNKLLKNRARLLLDGNRENYFLKKRPEPTFLIAARQKTTFLVDPYSIFYYTAAHQISGSEIDPDFCILLNDQQQKAAIQRQYVRGDINRKNITQVYALDPNKIKK